MLYTQFSNNLIRVINTEISKAVSEYDCVWDASSEVRHEWRKRLTGGCYAILCACEGWELDSFPIDLYISMMSTPTANQWMYEQSFDADCMPLGNEFLVSRPMSPIKEGIFLPMYKEVSIHESIPLPTIEQHGDWIVVAEGYDCDTVLTITNGMQVLSYTHLFEDGCLPSLEEILGLVL